MKSHLSPKNNQRPWSHGLLILSLALLMPVLGPACDRQPKMSGLEKRTATRLDRVETSAISLQQELDRLAHINITNTRDRMQQARKMIQKAKKSLAAADGHVKDYIAFTRDHDRMLRAAGLDRYIEVTTLLGRPLTAKRRAMADYVDTLDRWLAYSETHFERLLARDISATRTYDALLIAVNRRLKQYNTANARYHRHIKGVINRNPEAKKRFSSRYKTMKKELGWL